MLRREDCSDLKQHLKIICIIEIKFYYYTEKRKTFYRKKMDFEILTYNGGPEPAL